jgi:hypothetical protein
MNALAFYLAAVLTVISPALKSQRRDSIASDIAAVTLSSERVFDDDANGQKTALLLLSLAYWETGKSWAAWIDDGRCNDPLWRATHAEWLKGGDCDGGRAWSMWQDHVPHDSVIIGRSLITNRQAAIRVALSKARGSLQMGVGLCSYAGEHYPHCRKAELRLDTARKWETRFPYETTATSELASE